MATSAANLDLVQIGRKLKINQYLGEKEPRPAPGLKQIGVLSEKLIPARAALPSREEAASAKHQSIATAGLQSVSTSAANATSLGLTTSW
jgi:hypothetical protein